MRTDGKPSVPEIADASNTKYEIITYHGVEILIRRSALETAVELTCEWTHDKDVEKLATEMGIKLGRFRSTTINFGVSVAPAPRRTQ